ncbi:MAG TPA: PQQ-dependent sugar dehydrogenase [Steroidobacteraceae bacterium]|nr:PQQ-dependent sugar dehydrogenase [Steroidobacteraceae bacterium]
MLAALLLQACGGGDDGGGTPPPPPPPDTTAPTAPQNLAATASGPTQVALTWSASTDSGGAGLAGYRVLRGGTEIATTAATSYTDSGLAASTAYSYTVRAYDGATPANVSADSAPVNITTPATAVVGLDARPSNTTCLAGMPPRTDGARLDRVFTNLSFSSPILALQAPGNSSRWFVVQQGGRVLVFPNTATPVTNTFIDITSRVASGGELGLLGMAFHPNFPTDPRVFLSYTAGNGGSRVSRISSFRTTDGGLTLDTASEKIWLTLNQPEDNHNGGNINFGPDGFLYIGFGDGGGGGDAHTQNGPIGNGQSLTTMLGKMLRIDVGAETAPAYVIPSTNPFATNPKCGPTTNGLSCPEIYAYGLRNPWRWSFDRQSGELWVGDVGQGAYEEVDIVQRGGNYGWRCREGLHAYDMTGCPSSGFIDPVAEYTHADGQSITGGYVYRGTQATTLVGRYIFADYVSQRLWTLQPNTSGGFTVTNLLTAPFNVSSFAQAVDGELYVLDYGGGLYHLTFLAGAGGGTIPVSLAASGCVDASDPTQPASGLIPYTVNAPFWSDGAVKDRWIALPNGQNMAVAGDGDWTPPNGSILVKNFRLGTTLVETRLFMHHSDGSWAGYSYQWNDAQTDATLVSGGATKVWGAQTWIYPSEAGCLQCHTAVAGRALGLETAQMNRNFTYPTTGRTANQVVTLNAINTLTPPIAADPSTLPALPDLVAGSGTVPERARAYLHANCAQCHRPGGPTPVTLDFRYTTPLNMTNACLATPQAGDLGLGAAAKIITPGSAASSVLVARVNRRDVDQMPPLASNLVDTAGVALLTQWIDGLAACN